MSYPLLLTIDDDHRFIFVSPIHAIVIFNYIISCLFLQTSTLNAVMVMLSDAWVEATPSVVVYTRTTLASSSVTKDVSTPSAVS